MTIPYDLMLSDGTRRELYGPWRVAAAAVELIRARARAGNSLHVAVSPAPRLDPYGAQIDPTTVESVADRANGVAVPV